MRTQPLSVLVVDDYREAADSLADLLRLAGFTVSVAYTPTEALMAAGTAPVDAVVTDIGIPGLDGYRLAGRICARLPRRPLLVALTGYRELEERSRREGFDRHFLKPVDPAELVRVLGDTAR